jgi:hypothetical protein
VVDEYSLSRLARYFTGSSTSISIDADTGHAKDGALFEVEHINRLSLLSFEVVYINPVIRGIREFINTKNGHSLGISADLPRVSAMIRQGLEKLQFYGIGGKRSRGYGRIIVWEVEHQEELPSDLTESQLPSLGNLPQVFISYSSKNAAVARRLAADLQAQQLNVWLDEHKILVGDSIHRKVEEGITSCDYLVLLVSPQALQSEWVQEELNAIRTREKELGRTILLPAILDEIVID